MMTRDLNCTHLKRDRIKTSRSFDLIGIVIEVATSSFRSTKPTESYGSACWLGTDLARNFLLVRHCVTLKVTQSLVKLFDPFFGTYMGLFAF